jgi:hypothetical protein
MGDRHLMQLTGSRTEARASGCWPRGLSHRLRHDGRSG